MLTPKLIPLESEFTESDLKPGLRVLRKSDGAECVVMKIEEDAPYQWCIRAGDTLFRRKDYGTLWHKIDILHCLNSDFTPIEPRYKTVGELPPMVVFDVTTVRNMYRSDWVRGMAYSDCACVCLDDGVHYCLSVSMPVTRILGKLVFVEE